MRQVFPASYNDRLDRHDRQAVERSSSWRHELKLYMDHLQLKAGSRRLEFPQGIAGVDVLEQTCGTYLLFGSALHFANIGS